MFDTSKRVAAGAAFMDEKLPDWYKRIDCKMLDIPSGDHCILGQLYGGYSEGAKVVGITPNVSEAMGFLPKAVPAELGIGFDGRLLNRAWRKLIQERRRLETATA